VWIGRKNRDNRKTVDFFLRLHKRAEVEEVCQLCSINGMAQQRQLRSTSCSFFIQKSNAV
jgi:hypothetical protein